MKNTRPYIALRTPMSRTRSARREKSSASSSCRPNSLTSSAPATLKRSVMVVFISLFRSMPSRVMTCNWRPIRFAGMMNNGSRISVRSVRRHSRNAIAARVNASVTMFDTTEPSVPVSALCAPMTSLFMRLMRAPVCVRVKNAIGIRWVWSNSVRRNSKINPSPIFADHQRSPSDRNASASAIATMNKASVVTMPLSWLGMATSMMRLISSGGTMPTNASNTIVTRNAINIAR